MLKGEVVIDKLFRDLIAIRLRRNPCLREIVPYFTRLRGEEHLTRDNLETIERRLLEIAGFKDNMRGFLDKVSQETAVVTLIAGAGTRWIESFEKAENEELIERYKIKKDEPRAMARVDNLLDPNGGDIPVVMYNLLAVRNLGRQVIVYGGETDERAEENRKLMEKLTAKIGVYNVIFIRQRTYPGRGKPLGHGDAVLQALDDIQWEKELLKKAKIIITNFGCDANSYQTVVLSLLAMYVFDKCGVHLSLLIPTSISEDPEYPIYIDSHGLPVGTLHRKDNLAPPRNGESSFQSNVGIRIFRSSALLKVLNRYRGIYKKIKQGEDGVDYPNGELKIDHFERYMMAHPASHIVLTFPIALREEIAHTPKEIGVIPDYLKDLKTVLKQDDEFRKRNNLE